jgi:hypothetical protein
MAQTDTEIKKLKATGRDYHYLDGRRLVVFNRHARTLLTPGAGVGNG